MCPFMVSCLDFLVCELYKNSITVRGHPRSSFLTLCPLFQVVSVKGEFDLAVNSMQLILMRVYEKKKKKMALQ